MPKHLSKQDQLDLINKLKDKVIKNNVMKKVFKQYGVDIEDVYLFPVCFKDLDVSARTEHGVVFLHSKFLKDGFKEEDHYLAHELVHVLQQCYGDKPTKSSDTGDYLANKYEQEAFRNQTEYLSRTKGKDVAEEYVEDLLDYHDVEDEKERKQKKKKLLRTASGKEYPLEEKGSWTEENIYEKPGGKLIHISPDLFLALSAPLIISEDSVENLQELKEKIENGKLDPLSIYDLNRKPRSTDGRHRALAAKALGIKKVPVITYVNLET